MAVDQTVSPELRLALEAVAHSHGLTLDQVLGSTAAEGTAAPDVTTSDAAPAIGLTVADAVKRSIAATPGYGNNCYLRTLAYGWGLELSDFDDCFDDLAELVDELGPASGIDVEALLANRERFDEVVDGTEAPPTVHVFAGFGDLDLAALDTREVMAAMDAVKLRTLLTDRVRARRRAARELAPQEYHGDGAAENMYSAIGHLFAWARAENRAWRSLASPTDWVDRPQRHATDRSWMSEARLHQVRLAAIAANDVTLAELIFDFHLVTGARRVEAIRLRVRDIDADRCRIRLRGKRTRGRTSERWVPAPPSLIRRLLSLAWERGARTHDHPVLLRVPTAAGDLRPVTGRVYDSLNLRVQKQLDWAARGRWGVHWLRHHCAHELERLGGRAVKRRMLGHQGDVTDGYGIATEGELARTVERMTGERHPIADEYRSRQEVAA